jgi:dCMP deaminase
MIIVGITGTICSGKKTAAEYLQICYGFRTLNLESINWDSLGNHSSNNNIEDDYPSEESYREATAKLVLKSTEENIAANYIVYPITLPEELAVFRSAPNFLLLGIDAPAIKRYGHYNVKYIKRKSALINFLEVDDKVFYI